MSYSLSHCKCPAAHVVLGVVLGVVCWNTAAAQLGDGSIELEAESIHYDYNTGTSVYEGNVVITQSGMRLTGDKVEVFSEGGKISRLVSRAKPSTLQKHSDKDDMDAKADRIEYDVQRQIIVFMGNAIVDDGEKILRGERIIYDVEKRVVDATQSKGRVRLTINP